MDEIYELTRAGRDELSRSDTGLSPLQLELLIRIDGSLALRRIRAAMPAVADDAFAQALARLRERGLIETAKAPPFSFEFDVHPRATARPGGEAEADAGLRSLGQTGYYVGIARRPTTARTCRPDQGLVAVVVEDEPILARFIQTYMALEGFEVRIAGDRAAIVAEFNRRPPPDVVLLDVMLPDVDGFDVLRSMRRHKVLRRVPVVMLTGKATREAVLQGMAEGADGYVTKPFQPETLMRAVRTVVGLPERATEASAATDPWTNRDALRPRRPRGPSQGG